MKKLLGLLFAATVPNAALAVVLSFQAADPTGDFLGTWTTAPIDMVGTRLVIDNTTGAYTIDVTASSANPFTGSFRINWNSFNQTRNDQFFVNLVDFALGSSTATTMTISGTDAGLLTWQAGDILYLTSVGSTSSGFGNGVFGTPINTQSGPRDIFADSPSGAGSLVVVPSTSVPDAGNSITMLLLALLSMVAGRRLQGKMAAN